MKNDQLLSRFKPRSLLARMILLVLGSILLAQTIVSLIWFSQTQRQDDESLLGVTRSLALSTASTVNFFRSLPIEYRHIVLDQLRDMGGTRFFVSLNEEAIAINPIDDTTKKRLVIGEMHKILNQKLGPAMDLRVEFSSPTDLHVFNNQVLLKDLPPSWSEHTLIIGDLNAPILVTQMQLAEHEWLYLAALLPAPHTLLDQGRFPMEQALFTALMTCFLLVIGYAATRWLTEPLKRLSQAATNLGRDIDQPQLPENGPTEVSEAARAFNAMQSRLQRYIRDRETLFSAISHDLKTPITRIRLRAELLEEDEHRERLIRNLDELEMMVKGALQSVKDTDIHENIEEIDVIAMLLNIREELGEEAAKMQVIGELRRPFRGKPLALKRCMTNLIDNAIKYGKRVRVTVTDYENALYLYFRDFGPGVPMLERERIFEPYVRLDNSPHRESGTGLGLGIVRNIVHAHGGSIALSNHPQGGLLIRVLLPRK